MQLEHIALFNQIAQIKSISKVAKMSHLSQPALSIQMQKLEDEIGFKVFERSNKGIKLTEAGIILEKYAKQFGKIHEDFLEDIQRLHSTEDPFHIAAFPDVASYAIPCTLFIANKAFPGYNFYLSSLSNADVIRAVQYDHADIGFIMNESEAEIEGLESRKVFTDKICIVASRDLNTSNIKSLEDILTFPLLMTSQKDNYYKRIIKHLEKQGKSFETINKITFSDTTESIKSGVLARHGIAFLPYLSIKKELYLKQFKLIELDEFNLNYNVTLINKPLTDVSDVCKKDIINYIIKITAKSVC